MYFANFTVLEVMLVNKTEKFSTFLVIKYFSLINSVYVHNARKHPTKSVFLKFKYVHFQLFSPTEKRGFFTKL